MANNDVKKIEFKAQCSGKRIIICVTCHYVYIYRSVAGRQQRPSLSEMLEAYRKMEEYKLNSIMQRSAEKFGATQ